MGSDKHIKNGVECQKQKDHKLWRNVLDQYCSYRLSSEILHHGRNLSANDFRKDSAAFNIMNQSFAHQKVGAKLVRS